MLTSSRSFTKHKAVSHRTVERRRPNAPAFLGRREARWRRTGVCSRPSNPITSSQAIPEESGDFDAKREFLLGQVERVIYNRYEVALVGSVPVQAALEETRLQFRIESEIDGKAVRSRPRTIRAEDGRKEKLAVTAAEIWPKGRSERYCGRAEAKL
jgi:hypothetical protein